MRVLRALGILILCHVIPAGADTIQVALPDWFGQHVTPLAITNGPDGAMWFTGADANVIGRIDPKPPFSVSYINIPPPATAATSIVTGPDGNLWFTEYEGNRIGRVNPATNQIVMFTLPTAAAKPTVITAGPDGALWFTESGSTQIGRITVGGAISEIPVPLPYGPMNGIASGDGVLWVARQKTPSAPAALLRIVPNGGVTPLPLPAEFSRPYMLVRGADGAMWFTDTSGRLGRIDSSGGISAFAADEASTPISIAAARDGSIWFTDYDHARVGRLTPSRRVELFSTSPGAPQGMAIAPDGRVWVALPNLHALAIIDAPTAKTAGRRRLVRREQQRELAACAPGTVVKATNVLEVAVDDQYVYYGAGPDVARAPKNGGSAPTILARFPGSLVGLMTLDDTHLFFGTFDEETGAGTVTSLLKSGGSQRILVPNIMVPFEIFNDEDHVYVVSLGTPAEEDFLPDGKIIRAKKNGSEVKALASGLTFPQAFAMSGNNIFFSESDPERDFGSIKRVSTDGGPVSTVVQDVLALSMAADASGLYYSGIDLRTFEPGIRHLARSGGTPSTLVHEVFAESLRVIGNDLYYVNLFEDTPTIEAVPLTGGAARIIRSVDFLYPRFTFDSCLLYYGTGEGVERAAQ